MTKEYEKLLQDTIQFDIMPGLDRMYRLELLMVTKGDTDYHKVEELRKSLATVVKDYIGKYFVKE